MVVLRLVLTLMNFVERSTNYDSSFHYETKEFYDKL